MAVLAGIAAALGHAPFGYWPVSLAGFASLIWLVSAAPRPFLTGWAGGVGYFATTLHWIVEPFLVDVARHGWMAPFALVLLASGLALFWGAAAWSAARVTGPISYKEIGTENLQFSGPTEGRRAFAFAIALTLAELSRAYVLTGFPWALPAYIWTDTPVRMTASLWGPHGLTLIMLVLLSLPFLMRGPITRGAMGLCVCAGFAALFVIGALRDGQGATTSSIVRLVQPNAPQDEKWDPARAHVFVDRQIEFTAAEKAAGVDLIVWPESALPYRLRSAAPVLARVADAADGAEVVLGINRTAGERHHNSLITLPANGTPGEIYDKVHLVPFGEYIPFGQLAQFVGLQSFAARDGYGFSPGEEVRLIETGIGNALPLICYEAIFPQHIRKAGARPDFLLQITNDAWFGTFSGPYQHLQQAQFRAAEQGLPLIRAANTGVSAMIDARGHITARLEQGVADYLDAPLPAAISPTLYAVLGDVPVILFLFGMLGGLFVVNKRNTIA